MSATESVVNPASAAKTSGSVMPRWRFRKSAVGNARQIGVARFQSHVLELRRPVREEPQHLQPSRRWQGHGGDRTLGGFARGEGQPAPEAGHVVADQAAAAEGRLIEIDRAGKLVATIEVLVVGALEGCRVHRPGYPGAAA